MNQKRIRSINWDEEEKVLFRTVLKEYVPIIENKSVDTNTNKLKNKAWDEIQKKFNELNSRPRQLSQLKIQWKGMKMNARKIHSAFKKEIIKTGGGARPKTPDDSVIEVTDLLNPAELLRDHNIYDSDGSYGIILSPTHDFELVESTSGMCENENILGNQHNLLGTQIETAEFVVEQDVQECATEPKVSLRPYFHLQQNFCEKYPIVYSTASRKCKLYEKCNCRSNSITSCEYLRVQ